MLKIIKAGVCLKYCPTIWCESEVIFIPKPSKENYMEPRSFRPITLQPFVFKLNSIEQMEKRKFPKWFIDFYRNYLNNRVAVCNINGVTIRKFPKGSPPRRGI